MNAVAVAAPTNAVREHWSTVVLSTCVRHASLLQIIEWDDSGDQARRIDLRRLPATIYPVVFAKCQELIERTSNAETTGRRRPGIERRANAELWHFLKSWRRDGFVEVAR
jgi:hypothetical protein